MDEMEYGLEPHRIIRLLGSIGSRIDPPPLQTFMSTHSPVALKELAGSQLFVIRSGIETHTVRPVGSDALMQGTIRLYPEAFLARSVVICEGATEVGLLRGLDRYRVGNGFESIFASGVSLVDSGGGGADRPFKRAAAFQALGYRVAIVRDDDLQPTAAVEANFIASGGLVVRWHDGFALEEELFHCLDGGAIELLLNRAVSLNDENLINENIKSASDNTFTLESMKTEIQLFGIETNGRIALGKAAKCNKGWFKTISLMDDVAHDIVGPGLANAQHGLRERIESLFSWAGTNVG